MLLIILLY